MKVLIADDAVEVRFLHGEHVESCGHQPVFASDGDEAWEILNGPEPPKIVLLDWIMPGMDGIELTRRIKDVEGHPFTYVILVTGKDEKKDIVTALNAGADDILSKPVDPHEFASRLAVGMRTVKYESTLRKNAVEMAALAREREIFLQAFQHSVQGMCITDLNGKIIHSNTAFQESYGYSESEIAGKSTSFLNPGMQTYLDYGIPNEEYTRRFSELWSQIADPTIGHWKGRVLNRTKQGDIRTVNLVISTIRGANAEPISYLSMPIDVTSHVEQEAAIRLACYSAIVDLAEMRDNETGLHLKRVGEYCRLLAEGLGMTRKFIDDIILFAPFHDIGKVGIQDSILLAPRKLTKEEFEIIKTHPTLGYDILKDAPTLEMAAQIAYTHHEKYSGAGYPRGLAGDDIPLVGRIVALVDVYDALRTRRPYKEPWSNQKVVDLITEESGAHFDPKLVEVFLSCKDEFEAISEKWQDEV